jgi:hypothetical protein
MVIYKKQNIILFFIKKNPKKTNSFTGVVVDEPIYTFAKRTLP